MYIVRCGSSGSIIIISTLNVYGNTGECAIEPISPVYRGNVGAGIKAAGVYVHAYVRVFVWACACACTSARVYTRVLLS